jgi:hypothetical protein
MGMIWAPVKAMGFSWAKAPGWKVPATKSRLRRNDQPSSIERWATAGLELGGIGLVEISVMLTFFSLSQGGRIQYRREIAPQRQANHNAKS